MKRYLTVLSVIIVLTTLTKSYGQEKGSKLNITIDERIETLYSIAFFNDYFLVTNHQNVYKNKLSQEFNSLKSHKAVKLFDLLSTKYNFTFNRTVQWILQFSDFPEFKKTKQIAKNNSIVSKEKEYLLQEFRKELISFNQDTLFQKYLKVVKPINQEVITQVQKSNTLHNIPNFLETFYGDRLNSYNLILSPLLHSGGFNVELYDENGEKEVFGLIGPNGEIEFIPYFDKDHLEMHMILHEFGHSFVDHLIKEYEVGVDNLKDKYFNEQLQENAQSQGYNKWENVFNELVLRATTIKITEKYFGKKEANKLLEFEKNIGFELVEKIVGILTIYETNREEYPHFENFYPELLERMN